MRHVVMMVWVLMSSVALAVTHAAADEPKKAEAKPDNELVCTWKLVSAKYGDRERLLPEGFTMLKHVTPSQFMWATYDKDGNVDSALGGPYTLKGNEYVEKPEYGVGNVLQLLKGKAQSFKWKVESNKWYHKGNLSSGLSIEEVWERVEKK